MQHKKQFYEQLVRTHDWNKARGNTPTTLDLGLEVDMLSEELQEFVDAKTDVDRFDALLDLQFVLQGTLYKMGLTPQQVVSGYQHVLVANETKLGVKSSSGKISKPIDFVGPESKLQDILDQRG